MGVPVHSANEGDMAANGGRAGRGAGRRPGRVRLAFVGLLAAGVAVACGPAEGSAPAVPPPPSLTSSAPTTATPTPTPTPTPTASASPTAVPSPSVPPAADTDAKASADPAPARPAATTRPAPEPTTKAPTTAPDEPAKADCEIVSNAGNCYNAGQFCRKADVGRSTHAGNGRMIHCRQDGGQPRWGY
ncbi:hypothetical protein [Streptomyces sp. NPDC002032]|uniref:hypothetical protein n=1 Tax=Streptomyces sp. NPDC002032 TaxID=3364630 RepID=UPI00368B0C12